MSISFIQHDGGRAAAGFKGATGDCVTRAICIATGLPYTIVYDRLAQGNATQRISKHTRGKATTGKYTAAHGIWTKRQWFKDYMKELGFVWTPTMQVGSGCKVHLTHYELPKGKIIVVLSRHFAAVVDRILYDTYDSSRDGTRCVYGYYKFEGA